MNKNPSFQFSSNKFNFQIGKNEKPYADENALISDSPREVQSMIVGIFNVSQKYSKHDQIKGNESFEESLAGMENSLSNMFSQNLINLARETDFGLANISKYRTSLEIAQTSLHNSTTDHLNSNRQKFLQDYCKSLYERKKMINESINILDLQFQKETSSVSTNENTVNLLTSLCNEQHEAIIRTSSRIYKLNEKMVHIQSKLRSYKSIGFNSSSFSNPQVSAEHPKSNFEDIHLDDDKQFNNTITEKLISDYEAHVKEIKQNLEKHITDRSLFLKNPVQKTSGFSFGTGNRNGTFKANFGVNNMISSGVSTNTNKTIVSNPQNSVLSTPDSKSKRNNNNDLTPPVRKQEPLSGGLTGFNLGSQGPWAPKKPT